MKYTIFLMFFLFACQKKDQKNSSIQLASLAKLDSLLQHCEDSTLRYREDSLYIRAIKKEYHQNKDSLKRFDILITPHIFSPYSFSYNDIIVKNDTISGYLYETNMKKALPKRKLSHITTLWQSKLYVYEPKKVIFLNPKIARMFNEKLPNWNKISPHTIDSPNGYFHIKVTNERQQLKFLELNYFLDEDKELQELYYVLHKKLLGIEIEKFKPQ